MERALSFGTVAELYDEYRPGPPPRLLDHTGPLQGREVVELGAGTGLVTRFLVAQGATVTAVEPDDDMRAVLLRRSPQVVALANKAESISLPDASCVVIVASSAWHWFDAALVEAECARLLRDHGRLVVNWNGFARDREWIQRLTALREKESRPRGWTAELTATGAFHDVAHFEDAWSWPRTENQVVNLFRTYSGAIIQTEEARQGIDDEVRRQLREEFPAGDIEIPMVLRGTVATRAAR